MRSREASLRLSVNSAWALDALESVPKAMSSDGMPSTKPYLLRAMHEWIVDSNLTPHLLVAGQAPGLEVPPQAIQDGQVVLNVSPSAIRDLVMDNDGVSFVARFGGVSQAVWIPIAAVEGIYARENGRGMAFPEESDGPLPSSDQSTDSDADGEESKPSKGPSLRVIK